VVGVGDSGRRIFNPPLGVTGGQPRVYVTTAIETAAEQGGVGFRQGRSK
jgi:hypothetical protein